LKMGILQLNYNVENTQIHKLKYYD
jgi:hypothetical protein